MGMIREISALHADGVDLTDVFRDCHQGGHGAEWLAQVVRVQAGDNHPDTSVREGLADLHKVFAEELRFVDTHHIYVRRNLEHVLRVADRGALDAVQVVRDNLHV